MGTYVKDGNSCIGCSLLGEFPEECGGCGNLRSKVDLIELHASAQLPSPCTPEQYKEITGKDYPDDCLVWVKPRGGWVSVTYGLSKDYPFNYKPVAIVQTGQPSPKADWRPE